MEQQKRGPDQGVLPATINREIVDLCVNNGGELTLRLSSRMMLYLAGLCARNLSA